MPYIDTDTTSLFKYVMNSLYGTTGFRNPKLPIPTKVIYNGNKTIVIWDDTTKTIVTCGKNEDFDHYTGFCAAFVKKTFGSTSRTKKMLKGIVDDQNNKRKKGNQNE